VQRGKTDLWSLPTDRPPPPTLSVFKRFSKFIGPSFEKQSKTHLSVVPTDRTPRYNNRTTEINTSEFKINLRRLYMYTIDKYTMKRPQIIIYYQLKIGYFNHHYNMLKLLPLAKTIPIFFQASKHYLLLLFPSL